MKIDLAFKELSILLKYKFDLDSVGRSSYDYDNRIKELRKFIDEQQDTDEINPEYDHSNVEKVVL
jgi:hypothetical protein